MSSSDENTPVKGKGKAIKRRARPLFILDEAEQDGSSDDGPQDDWNVPVKQSKQKAGYARIESATRRYHEDLALTEMNMNIDRREEISRANIAGMRASTSTWDRPAQDRRALQNQVQDQVDEIIAGILPPLDIPATAPTNIHRGKVGKNCTHCVTCKRWYPNTFADEHFATKHVDNPAPAGEPPQPENCSPVTLTPTRPPPELRPLAPPQRGILLARAKIRCEVCDTDIYKKNLNRHLKTKAHKTKELQGAGIEIETEQRITDSFCITVNNKCDKYQLFNYLLAGCEYNDSTIDVTECVIGKEFGVTTHNEHYHVYLKLKEKTGYRNVLSWLRSYAELCVFDDDQSYIIERGKSIRQFENVCEFLTVDATDDDDDDGSDYESETEYGTLVKSACEQPMDYIFPITSVYLETAKDRKAWIKYCTKEDNEPLMYNIDKDLMNKNAKQWLYIKHSRKWDIESYVVKSTGWTDVKMFRARHSLYWAEIKKAEAYEQSFLYHNAHLLLHMKATDKKGIVLWGEAGCGKTSTALTFMGTDYYTILTSSNFMLTSYTEQKTHLY